MLWLLNAKIVLSALLCIVNHLESGSVCPPAEPTLTCSSSLGIGSSCPGLNQLTVSFTHNDAEFPEQRDRVKAEV